VTLTEAPTSWPNPAPMSMLHVLLLFVGVPLLIITVVTLLVITPSLIRGPRYRPGLSWWAKPEWFAGPERGLHALDDRSDRALEAGPSAGVQSRPSVGATAYDPGQGRPQGWVGGGASASW
jgi:hypothetical protein